jgi:hypothetical protein
LKAAYFGKLFADDYPSDQHVDQAKILRVLNAVRFYEVGIPLTYAQFQRLEAQVVINRLTARHHHLLALRISQYLNIPEDKVLVHWASAKIIAAEDEDDMTLANAVVAKLSKCSTVSFAAVAGIAARTGRRKLAIRLLEYETKASKQVPSLLAMHEHALALQKAIDSGDTDLISIVLLQMEARAESKAETKFEFKQFVTLIESKPIAWSIYTNYLKTQGQMQRLERLYGINEALHRVEAANVAILQAYRYKNFQDRFQLFGFAQEFYESSKKASFAANATKEHILLMKVQMKAAREHKDVSFLDASVSDILAKFIAMGKEKDALAIRRQFNVPDKRFWHIKVRTLARYDVNELRSLFEGGSNPIGVQPFIEACQEFGHKKEAVHFIKKIKHPLERMDALCNAGEWSDAAKVAVGERNRQALEMIAARCRMPEVVAYINEQIDSGAV